MYAEECRGLADLLWRKGPEVSHYACILYFVCACIQFCCFAMNYDTMSVKSVVQIKSTMVFNLVFS